MSPPPLNIARQWLRKHVPPGNEHIHNRRIVGHGVYYAVHVISNTKYVLKGKQAINSYENFLFHRRGGGRELTLKPPKKIFKNCPKGVGPYSKTQVVPQTVFKNLW